MIESWHDAQQMREEALDLFSLGLLNLTIRAQVESLYWTIAGEVRRLTAEMKHPPEELRMLPKMLADKYFCNFSLFQSLPDSWAIDQLFPIMPIHRLQEKPMREATLQDITCDSDGKIDKFVGPRDFVPYIPVHDLKEGEPYYLAVFLVGAYQEILGDLHNLFGIQMLSTSSPTVTAMKFSKSLMVKRLPMYLIMCSSVLKSSFGRWKPG
jgi:arginine decarboxylase